MAQDIKSSFTTLTVETRYWLEQNEIQKRKLSLLGEFDPQLKAELEREFLPRRISDTLNIEGIRVNPRVTRAILEGQALSDEDRYGEKEILNVLDANQLIERIARDEPFLTTEFIKEIHYQLMKDLLPDAGCWRDRDVKITGASFIPPMSTDVLTLMENVVEDFNNAVANGEDWIFLSAWLHQSFTEIHPFVDGNGRTGRCLQDFVLLLGSFLPVGIPSDRRMDYYEALAEADNSKWDALVEIIASSETVMLGRAIDIVQRSKSREARLKSIVNQISSNKSNSEKRLYHLWLSRTESVVTAFTHAFNDINDALKDEDSGSIRIVYRVYPSIEFQSWKTLSGGQPAEKSWSLYFGLQVDGKRLFNYILYPKRHTYWLVDDDVEISPGHVGLFLTGTQEGEHYRFDYFADAYVSLREILYANDEWRLYSEKTIVSQSSTTVEAQSSPEKWMVSYPRSIDEIALQTINEIFKKGGLI